MDRNLPHGRRRARALAISESVEARRVAATQRLVVLALGGFAVVAEAAMIVHRLWAVHA